MYKQILVLFGLSFFFLNANSQDIVGLWVVSEVGVNDRTSTPVARWMRFNEDGTQESGNGWLKHSEGFYNYNKKNQSLTVENTDGIKDLNPAFNVSFSDGYMIWDRMEEDASLTIQLSRIDEIPAAPLDRLRGLWMIEETNPAAPMYVSDGTLFFRWDHTFVYTNTLGDRSFGVYKTHGHKPEVELIYYGEDCRREWWTFSFEASDLNLKNVKIDGAELELKRIDQFPN